MTESKPGNLEQQCIDALDGQIRKVGQQLRRLADMMDRRAEELTVVGTSRHPNYGNVVSLVLCDFKQEIHRMSLDGLVCSAADTDGLRTQRIAAEAIASSIDAKEAAARNVPVEPGAPTERADAIAGCAWIARDYAKREA